MTRRTLFNTVNVDTVLRKVLKEIPALVTLSRSPLRLRMRGGGLFTFLFAAV